MPRTSSISRTGVWLAGAKGDIATTLMVGTLALDKGLISTTGLTTALPPLSLLPLVTPGDFVFGGIDISSRPLFQAAESLYRNSRTIDRETLDAVTPALERIERDILIAPDMNWRPNSPISGTTPLDELVNRLRHQLREFREKHHLEQVVVVNLTSAEPEPRPCAEHDSMAGLEQLMNEDRKERITPSICYVYAALMEGCSYLNFTPNAGTTLAGIEALAEKKHLPYYGNDGKTGETLLKTALAPMFAHRNLQVLSWEGVNLLGNSDGRALDNPDNRTAKLRNKESVLESILGYSPHSGIDINYVPSLGDWKTAWDLIHFQGFLDVKMSMQFTWQGCDSILAAPLVLDMVRLAEFAARNGESGPMHHLAAFFKRPIGVDEMDFHAQFERLLAYAQEHLHRQTDSASLNHAG